MGESVCKIIFFHLLSFSTTILQTPQAVIQGPFNFFLNKINKLIILGLPMNETKMFRGLMLSRVEILLVSIIIGSLLGGFAAAAAQNYHYQNEVLPHYQAKVAIQEKTIGEPMNKQETDWTKQGFSKVQVAILMRQQQMEGGKYG